MTLFSEVISRRRDFTIDGDLEQHRDQLKEFYKELKQQPFYQGYDDEKDKTNYVENAYGRTPTFIDGTNELVNDISEDRDRTVKAAFQPRIG